MPFYALELAISTIRTVRPLVPPIRTRDPRLARDLHEAVNSVPLNLAEGNRRRGRDRIHHFNIAAGIADEARTALRVADAWGYIDERKTREALAQLDELEIR